MTSSSENGQKAVEGVENPIDLYDYLKKQERMLILNLLLFAKTTCN